MHATTGTDRQNLLRYDGRIELRGYANMMIHHMLSVARRATPPSGASLTPAATVSSENADAPQSAPSPSAAPMSTHRPAPTVQATPVTVSNAGAQVALPTALAAYQEFAE
jgi:hypothetical protein